MHFGYADVIAGAARASYRLHRELLSQGVDSRMVVWRKLSKDGTVRGPRNSVGRRAAEWWPLADYAPLRLVQPGRREVSLGWVGSGRIREVLALRPDVVQLHWLCGGLVRPPALRLLARVPVVWRLPDMWPLAGVEHYPESDGWLSGYDGQPEWRGRVPLNVDRWAWRRKQRAYAHIGSLTVVSPSTWLAEQARRSPLMAGRRVEVIHTGVDVRAFRPLDRAAARARWGLPAEGPVVLFGANGGGQNPRKGYDRLMTALAWLTAHWEGAPGTLAVFGESGPVERHGAWLLRRLGRVEDEGALVQAYASADVFVAPSLAENLANTVLESLACGTPVAAFAVGGMPDAVAHREWGYLARPGDGDDLGRGIAWLLARADEGPLMRERARRAAEQRFDQRTQAARYANLYAEVAGERRAGRGREEKGAAGGRAG